MIIGIINVPLALFKTLLFHLIPEYGLDDGMDLKFCTLNRVNGHRCAPGSRDSCRV